MQLSKLTKIIETKYPLELQEKWDCSGFLYQNETDVKKVLVTLDITEKVCAYAIKNEVDLIISHHPLIFQNYFASYEYIRMIFQKLYAANISIYGMHTNFDNSEDGMNTTFIKKLGYQPLQTLGMLKFFESNQDLYQVIKNQYPYARIYNFNSKIDKVAVCLGAGGSFVEEVKQNGATMLISSEFKHHEILYAKENNITLVDIAHQAEAIFAAKVANYLINNTQNIEIDVLVDEYVIDNV